MCYTLKGNSGMNKHMATVPTLPQVPPSSSPSPWLSFLGSGWERGIGRVTLKCNDFNSLRVPQGIKWKRWLCFFFLPLTPTSGTWAGLWIITTHFSTEGKFTLPYPSHFNQVPSLDFFLSFEHRPGPSPEFNLTSSIHELQQKLPLPW